MSTLTARLLSILIEAPIAAIWVRWRNWSARGGAVGVVGVAIVGTLASHPLAWDGVSFLRHKVGFWITAGVVELGVLVGEAILYVWITELDWRRALLLSGIANGSSFFLGLIISYCIG